MNAPRYGYFRAEALDEVTLQQRAPSMFATSAMSGVSDRYAFLPTARVLAGLRKLDWIPVEVEEQRTRQEHRRGFQKHLVRFRRAGQMNSVDEWNIELVLLNSHDGGCAYQLHAGLFRRICQNGLVVSDGAFEAMRFRHSKLDADQVIQASVRVVEAMPRVSESLARFRERILEPREALRLAEHALVIRYGQLDEAPIAASQLLNARRMEDEGPDLWRTMNRIQENLIRGGLPGMRTDPRGRRRSMLSLRSIDSKLGLNKELWDLAEQVANHVPLGLPGPITLSE